jgi:hypothetical protein
MRLNDKPVTVEDFLPGKFAKYVNNNGIVLPHLEAGAVKLKKYMPLVHYSYSATQHNAVRYSRVKI